MASFIPVHNESDVDSFRPSNPANAKETRVATFGGRPDSPVNFSPENNEKKLTPQHEKQFRQMSRETLSPQYRRERLKRLVYNSQQPYSCPDPNFIRTTQMGVMQPTWRRKVVEWLLEFVDEFGLPNDIVAVAITYLDVYLSRKQVDKVHLQLLAMVWRRCSKPGLAISGISKHTRACRRIDDRRPLRRRAGMSNMIVQQRRS